ncbi:MAG: ketohexokinase [Gammaproteobacteria bacterium]|nr:ketohexokinase [Gammaproteobacteria bacterium]NIR97657.1 ketohexokinase [Gammaproteobacteria bacterium]NIT63318.1 ketohexokinase [Gammaproteobacteria bacterium]NIV20236.1 ketohexokinase [Gammaproteobacteria bacterium]NIX10653.1 ketohexokinase [Gammaproteobacteria bacterium]
MARILGIGNATVDVINTVDGYPAEDAEVRAVSQRIVRGGNAANTLVVLSQLGHRCAWVGTLAREPDAERIGADLERHRIDYSHCRWEERGKVPVSYVALNARNGSRTIVHYRDLPELDTEHFTALDLSPYAWIHFEGRNVSQTLAMMQRARARGAATVSLEVEKPREGIQALLPWADVVLFSRAYARARGFDGAATFLRAMRARTPAELVCAWGGGGACALGRDDTEACCDAFPPPRVVDTLGAGDTFNAGIIDARLQGLGWPAALEAAARLAGRKCGQVGLDGLLAAD